MGMLSPSLRLDVTKHIFISAIGKNKSIFTDNDELIDEIVIRLQTLLYLPEDQMIR